MNLIDTPNIDQNISRLILDTPFIDRNIISYGLVVYALDTKKWVIIQRKHSAEFLLLIRGLYRKSHIPFLLIHITPDEANILTNCINNVDFFTSFYINELNLPDTGLDYAITRIKESYSIFQHLLLKFNVSENTLNWTWPKGRLSNTTSYKEKPLECAIREFIEEVEIQLPNALYISDDYVTEIIKTLSGRHIESRYWLYIIPNEINLYPPINHPEVSNRIWINISDTLDKLYNNDTIFKILQLIPIQLNI